MDNNTIYNKSTIYRYIMIKPLNGDCEWKKKKNVFLYILELHKIYLLYLITLIFFLSILKVFFFILWTTWRRDNLLFNSCVHRLYFSIYNAPNIDNSVFGIRNAYYRFWMVIIFHFFVLHNIFFYRVSGSEVITFSTFFWQS